MKVEDEEKQFLVKQGPGFEKKDIQFGRENPDGGPKITVRWSKAQPQHIMTFAELEKLRSWFEWGWLVLASPAGAAMDWETVLQNTLPKIVDYRWLHSRSKEFMVKLATEMGIGTTDLDGVPPDKKQKLPQQMSRLNLVAAVKQFTDTPAYQVYRQKKLKDDEVQDIAQLKADATQKAAEAAELLEAARKAEAEQDARLAALKVERENSPPPAEEPPEAPTAEAEGPELTPNEKMVQAKTEAREALEAAQGGEAEDENVMVEGVPFDRVAAKASLDALPDKGAVVAKANELGVTFGPRDTKADLIEMILDAMEPEQPATAEDQE